MRSTTPERLRMNLEANEAGEFVFIPTGEPQTIWTSKDEAGGVFIELDPGQTHLMELLGLLPLQSQETANRQSFSPPPSSCSPTAGPAPFPWDRFEPTAETQSLAAKFRRWFGLIPSLFRLGRGS